MSFRVGVVEAFVVQACGRFAVSSSVRGHHDPFKVFRNMAAKIGARTRDRVFLINEDEVRILNLPAAMQGHVGWGYCDQGLNNYRPRPVIIFGLDDRNTPQVDVL